MLTIKCPKGGVYAAKQQAELFVADDMEYIEYMSWWRRTPLGEYRLQVQSKYGVDTMAVVVPEMR